MKTLAVIVFLAMPVIIFSQEPAPINDLSILDWLEGSWEYKSDKTITIEKWEKVSPGTFDGINYVRKIDEKAAGFSESLRILNMTGEIFYLAKVDHNELPIPFKLVSNNGEKFIFENMDHDFPQRITYYNVRPDSLTVRVESVSTEKQRFFEVQFKKVN